MRERGPIARRPLHPARVGRHHRHRALAQVRGEVLREQIVRAQVLRASAKRVLEGGQAVDLERDDGPRTQRLEQLRHVAGRDGIAGLGPPLLARVAEEGNDGRHVRRGRVHQRAEEEQQADQLVVHALLGVPVQGMDHVHVPPAHALQRTRLVVAELELPLLVLREWNPEPLGHALGERAVRVQPEQRELRVLHAPPPSPRTPSSR